MKVTYPFYEEVYSSKFRGTLSPTYSNTMQKHVIGNLCPHCEAYQGNWFVRDDGLMGNAYELLDHIAGSIELTINCMFCGNELPENTFDEDLFNDLDRLYDYLVVENFSPQERKTTYKKRLKEGCYFWLCNSCSEIQVKKRAK